MRRNKQCQLSDIPTPFASVWAGISAGRTVSPFRALKGRITYINHDHQYFLVEAVTENGTRIRECFKF